MRALFAVLVLALVAVASATPAVIDSSNIAQAFAHAPQHAQGHQQEPTDMPDTIDADNIMQAFRSKSFNATAPITPGQVNGVFGIDLSQGYALGTWQCLRNQGYQFAIVRGWQSICRLDPYARSNIQNARAAGFQYVDVYLYPQLACGMSAAQQVDGLIDGLSGINYGMIWFDIESAGSSWADANTNYNWLSQAVARAAQRIGRNKLGIYTNKYNWQTVMANKSGFQDLPVWYAHYDGNPSYSDWSSFGGWARPSIKQYYGDASVCGAGVDLNWY